MAYPVDPVTLFAAGDDAVAGGGTIRDQLLHTSFSFTFEVKHPYANLTITCENGLDKPINVILYGENVAGKTHQCGAVVPILAAGLDYMTLTDKFCKLWITVQETSGANPTAGDFTAALTAVVPS